MDSRRLDEKLAPAMEEADIARVWRRVKDARREAPSRRRRLIGIGVAVAVAAAAAAAAAIVIATDGDGPRQVAGDGAPLMVGEERPAGAGPTDRAAVTGPIASPEIALEAGVRVVPTRARSIALDDGSVIALAAASELEVLANEADKLVTALRKGWARFDVKPGGARRWIVETDLATVEVVGTTFVVERSEARLVVTVEHGVVLVRGERVPGRVVRLTAGEHVDIPFLPSEREPEGGTRGERGPAAVDRRDHSTSFDSPSLRSDSLRTNGDDSVAPDGAEAAIARADALLAKGKAIDAADELDRFLDDAGDDAGAGLAAFMLGRIAQDQLGDPERAAAAFARTLAIGSPRAVQDEARTRRARALAAAGRAE